MGNKAYRIISYSIDKLVELLAENSTTDFVRSKTHSAYFEGYFGELKAQTIIVENEYVDHDYLDDFTAYYVRCFRLYHRTTRRLHFFSIAFGEERFANLINGTDQEFLSLLRENYLGFIVVKPLPQTLIGRSCLRTYPDDGGRRNFPILRRYEANLFGIKLEVETLAFQEQDSVVAACATSALWSAFQATGYLFHHRIPSPAEITKAASDHIPEEFPQFLPETRGMPNHGLTATQMAHAIREVGLESYLVGANDTQILKSTLYAYLRAKIPVILVFGLAEISIGDTQLNHIGRHGVAVTGFSLGAQCPMAIQPTNVFLKAMRMDKIYVHDDQVGPFARMDFRTDGLLDTSWFVKQNRHIVACPQLLLVPLYHKIRIPYGYILEVALEIGGLLDAALKSIDLNNVIEWDIYLTTVNQVKSEVFQSSVATSQEPFLTQHLPKYLWRASAYLDGNLNLDLIFDATDLEQSDTFITSLAYGDGLEGILRLIATHFTPTDAKPTLAGVFRFFSDKPAA